MSHLIIYYNDDLDLKILTDRTLVEVRNNPHLTFKEDKVVKSNHCGFKNKVVYETNIVEDYFNEIIKERILDIKVLRIEQLSLTVAEKLKAFFKSGGLEADLSNKD